ncbi:hypothetical protein HGH93_12120 [Chitinophaga polysaccharea]|uniref:hypothetical protein n=1 Tax=Chitinophaga polysaccharea TaxID=1293035 RepID=UPI0014556492|nr:hypothetical protein [Chitinophaga polysaccharea]NLR58853.1 hypothetical protein [Chitinophaga polysaccharea]
MDKFPEYTLSIKLGQLFPPRPISNVPSEDVLRRISNLPVYIRTQTCATFGWDDGKYYRKVMGTALMTVEEEKKFLEIVTNAFKKYHDFMFGQYIRPQRTIGKKIFRKSR